MHFAHYFRTIKKKTASESCLFLKKVFLLLWGVAKKIYNVLGGVLQYLLYHRSIQKCSQISLFTLYFFVHFVCSNYKNIYNMTFFAILGLMNQRNYITPQITLQIQLSKFFLCLIEVLHICVVR